MQLRREACRAARGWRSSPPKADEPPASGAGFPACQGNYAKLLHNTLLRPGAPARLLLAQSRIEIECGSMDPDSLGAGKDSDNAETHDLRGCRGDLVDGSSFDGQARPDGMAGTDRIAQRGQHVPAYGDWPEGVLGIVNDSTRADGWRDWFTEWPNDVVHFRLHATNTADVNRLIRKLAAIQGSSCQVRLAPFREPQGLGWVTSLAAGNNASVIFSIGDQEAVVEWYAPFE